jgi:2-dehydropantoate 2-reductase
MTKSPQTQLRFLCFGTGAIGTYIGGSLALAGHKVVFLDRPEYVQTLREDGLHLHLQDENFHYANPDVVPTIEDALTQGPFDLVIFAVKSFDTRKVLNYFSPYIVALPPFLCLQNGMENEGVLADMLGEEKIISGTVTSAITKLGVGQIVLERLRGMGVASGHVLAPTLVGVLDGAGLNARIYHSALSMKWSKLLTNLLANASSAILDMTPEEIFSRGDLFRLEVQQIREALAVMRAQNIPVVDLPGTPVRALSLSIRYLPLKLSQPILLRAVGRGRGEKMPSFHIDLYSDSTQSEVEFLNGFVVRQGEKLGIPTPVNDLLTSILKKMMKGDINRNEYAGKPDKLIALMR